MIMDVETMLNPQTDMLQYQPDQLAQMQFQAMAAQSFQQ